MATQFPVAFFDSESLSSIGIRFDRHRGEARATWLAFPGPPVTHQPEIRGCTFESLPAELLRSFNSIEQDSTSLRTLDSVSTELTTITARLCQQLIADASELADQILTIGIHGAGAWSGDVGGKQYLSLVHGAAIAEMFGKTVVDDFPARDLARGGDGGPIESHGLWMLLVDRSRAPGRRWRGVLNIAGNATHLSTIRPLADESEFFLSTDICVGARLFAEIIAARNPVDLNSEKVSPQNVDCSKGTVIEELDEIWRSVSGSQERWDPRGVNVLPLVYALKNSIYANAELNDLLTTAAYFITRSVAQYVKFVVPPTCPIGELFVMEEGPQAGLVRAWLKEFLPAVSIRNLDELGQDRTILAASVAALSMMHVWQIPVPSTTTGEVPRVLGRITPGSPSNWQRVLHTMTSNAPWLLPLREAI